MYYFDIVDSLHGVLIAVDVNVFLACRGKFDVQFFLPKSLKFDYVCIY